MAKIFDGWRSEKDVLKDFLENDLKNYEIVFAYKDQKTDDYIIFLKKDNKVWYTLGNTDENKSILDFVERIKINDLTHLFQGEKWYKKYKVDIESNFSNNIKESFVVFLKESDSDVDYWTDHPTELRGCEFVIKKPWVFPEFGINYQPGDIVKIFRTAPMVMGKIKNVLVAKPGPSRMSKPTEADDMTIAELFKHADPTKETQAVMKKSRDAYENYLAALKKNSEEKFERLEQLVKSHDKNYQYSDDHRAFSKGDDVQKMINNLAIELRKIDPERVKKVLG